MHTNALQKTCLYCGKLFSKPMTVSVKDWESAKYCSYPCYWSSKKKDRIRTCSYCGKEFQRKHWNNPKFCSLECSSKSQKKPLPICELCGKTCSKLGRRFCSPECKKQWYRGDKVYCYVGDNLRKQDFPYDYSDWMRMAEKARERDKTCQHCGKSCIENGRALDVHHIIPYRISKDNSLPNLVSLCRSCHKKADGQFRQ